VALAGAEVDGMEAAQAALNKAEAARVATSKGKAKGGESPIAWTLEAARVAGGTRAGADAPLAHHAPSQPQPLTGASRLGIAHGDGSHANASQWERGRTNLSHKKGAARKALATAKACGGGVVAATAAFAAAEAACVAHNALPHDKRSHREGRVAK